MVVSTGYPMQEAAKELVEAPRAAGVLEKPYDASGLLRVVREALDRRGDARRLINRYN